MKHVLAIIEEYINVAHFGTEIYRSLSPIDGFSVGKIWIFSLEPLLFVV